MNKQKSLYMIFGTSLYFNQLGKVLNILVFYRLTVHWMSEHLMEGLVFQLHEKFRVKVAVIKIDSAAVKKLILFHKI